MNEDNPNPFIMADKFTVKTDRFLGVTIDCGKQNFSSDENFVDSLKAAIEEWKHGDRRGLWVKVHRSSATLVPLLAQLGLDFHHAQPGYVMMTMWMSDDCPNHLPEYANHYIGVSGFVVNDQKQLLVIREKYTDKSVSAWKLPGGHADKGEDLANTARREVMEETGIECQFVSLLTFRHQHNYRFGCSDIYFVCVMKPVTTEIKPCPMEIADCQWMDMDDYIGDSSVSDANRHFAKCYKDGLEHENYVIVPTTVLSFDKKTFHKVYSVNDASNHLQH